MSYWGSRERESVNAWNLIDSIKSQSLTGLKIGGEKANLWIPRDNGLVCSCKRPETDAFEKMCISCYGTGKIGGYRKYGYKYIYISSIDTDLILNDLVLFEDFRPFRLRIADNKLTGYLETSDLYVDNSEGREYSWEAKIYVKDVGGSYRIDYSIDGGVTWKELTQDNLMREPFLVGLIRFRIVLSRESLDIRSPYFEIFRFRWLDRDSDIVYISRVRSPKDEKKDKYGLSDSEGSLRFWTIVDEDLKPLSFIKFIEGPHVNDVYSIFDFNKTFFQGKLLRQTFSGRVIDREKEIYTKVF